jgi:thiol-disulfide isomerase/thioredoxin/outer membrane protein assembly factor BamB
MSSSTEDAPIRAPEIDGATAWLNIDRPLSLKALRGKIVLLDFWTYGCINCIHLLPELKRLEARYANELVVIGVHSPKFDNEKSTENLRQIVRRYEIPHPVANDAAFRIWRAYTVRAWPTQVLIDPAGYIVGAASGEGHAEQFDRAIAAVISVFEERGELDRRPLPLVLERAPEPGPLMFPGKVLADPAGGRLFVADSNHNRILVCALPGHVGPLPANVDPLRNIPPLPGGEGAGGEGRLQPSDEVDTLRVISVAGTGAAGRVDGGFDVATFHRPQGLALIGDTLFVADTENHVIRALDLEARVVTTVAGTGNQARWNGEGGAATQQSLNSPWDLAAYDGRLLFIAMAGAHQIWMLDPSRGLVWPYAGSGREARADGVLDAAAFAQPSGVVIEGSVMYVADAESNIIRAIDLPPTNTVRTLAGGDLFDFGDVDGTGDAVRLQHPLGVAVHDGRVLVADTYNHRLKALDPRTGAVRALAGDGRPGHEDGPALQARFSEPGGLTAAGWQLFVADTNNHAVRRVDLRTGAVTTLRLVGAL